MEKIIQTYTSALLQYLPKLREHLVVFVSEVLDLSPNRLLPECEIVQVSDHWYEFRGTRVLVDEHGKPLLHEAAHALLTEPVTVGFNGDFPKVEEYV